MFLGVKRVEFPCNHLISDRLIIYNYWLFNSVGFVVVNFFNEVVHRLSFESYPTLVMKLWKLVLGEILRLQSLIA
jgi:hypothetical protein